jgi:uncharacterized membrane protein/thiol-disulfide isomerase/thioredoxin
MTIIPIMNSLKRLIPILGLLALLAPAPLNSQAPEPVVHAILFFHPTCPHCHQLINEHLIPLQNQYGNRLVLLGMDTSQPWANNLYFEALRFFQLPEEDWVVPILIVDDQVLIGGGEIPQRLPTIIEEGLAGGGIDLPDYPALVTFVTEQNLLDPRYPDRLIVRQAQDAEAEEAPPGRDSVPSQEAPLGGDSVASVDSVAPGDPVPMDTAAPGESPAAGADSTSREDAPAVSSDTAGTVGEPSIPATETAGGRDVPPVDPASGVQAPVNETPAVQRPGADPEAGGPSNAGSMDLTEAARGLESMTMWDRFNLDPTGSSISVLVLLGMIVSLGLRGFPPRVRGGEWPGWVIPVLVVVGVGVASYLSFIEITHAQAACGPVGDCNTVNQSKYATLFGVLPVGVLGLMGYGLILFLWLLRRVGSEEGRKLASVGLWGAALFGTLFSVYLTFLEPFVIGATCAWCLSSAVIMTLLLWASAPMAARAWPGSE